MGERERKRRGINKKEKRVEIIRKKSFIQYVGHIQCHFLTVYCVILFKQFKCRKFNRIFMLFMFE